MSHPNSSNDSASRKRNVGKLVLGLLLLAVAVALFLVFRGAGGGPGDGGRADGGATSETQARLDLTRTALAATENLEMDQADQSWSSLFQTTPQDASVALNRAINRVLRVDQLSARATNASLDDTEKKEARRQLPDAISGARQAVDEFEQVADDAVTALWLRTRVDLHEASLLPGSMTRSLRKQIYTRLAESVSGDLGKRKSGRMLGGSLIQVVDQMEDPIDGLPDDVLADAAKTIGDLSDQHPDNLFFALRAARLGIASQNKQAAEFVERASQLAKAIEPLIRRETQPIGVTPDELVTQITSAIAAEDWSQAENRMLLWFNVLNSTEIVKTDRRRASPHPLDLLSFDSLRRLSAEVVESSPLEQAAGDITFDEMKIEASSDIQTLLSIDFDLDLVPDLVSVNRDGLLQLWSNDGNGSWNQAGRLQLDIEPRAMVAADLFLVDSSNPDRMRADRRSAEGSEPDYAAAVRHDTFRSLVAFGADGVRVVQVDGRSTATDETRLRLVDGDTGLEDVRSVTAAVAGDLEADGDLDLVFATETDNVRLFVNRGNRTFFEVTEIDNRFATDDPVSAMAVADLDRDLDLDIVTTHATSGRVGILENLLHLQFRGRFLDEIPKIDGASAVEVEDVDGNVSWDLIVGGSDQAAIVFSQTADAGRWTVDHIERAAQPSPAVIVEDFDNDSWFELLAQGSGQTKLSRIGPWGFAPWEPGPAAAALVAADFERNGSVDLAGVRAGQIGAWSNRSQRIGHHLDVRFKGIDDNVSGRINHFGIGSVLELRFGPHYRARIIRSPSTHFGLDGLAAASSVRAILPNGLTQTIRDPKIDSLVEEEQTLKGSCPYLYAWDGEKFVFKTDCLWAAPLGLQVARGVVAKDRPWEYLKIDGDDIRPRDDRYEFRITEELWEVAYFDKVALTVVDHPADVEVWTNEKVGPAEIAMPTIFAFAKQDLHSLRSAVDTFGRDVTAKLACPDRDFVQGFDHRLRQGLCRPHWIDLDFGTIAADRDNLADRGTVHLILTGWILPTDTSLNIQIDQNPQLGPIEFPSVWVPDASADDGWRTAIPFIGFPGGKTKTIVVDVTDVFSRSDPRLRVRTSAQIYWDSAQIAVQSAPAEFVARDVSLLRAEVAFHGFSERLQEDSTQPEIYDYQRSSLASRWPPLRGSLTRFGQCTDLVRDWDDSMVVISSGDEIRFEFAVPETQLPAGWQRDFVFHSVGWDKDADLNTLSGQSTGPLPYREMTAYPPPARDDVKAKRLEQRNRHHLQRRQAFRSFWYRTDPEPTMRFHAAAQTLDPSSTR